MKTDIFQNYINPNVISQKRTPNEFIKWFENILNITKIHKNELHEQVLLHVAIAKQFYEELFPLYRLLQHKKEDWHDAYFSPVLGNQNFDVEINTETTAIPRYIEITQADMNESEYLRMKYFVDQGSVNLLGKVKKIGNKRSGMKISVAEEAVESRCFNEQKRNQIKLAIEKKEKSKQRYNRETALLVYYDDYVSLNDGTHKVKLMSFLNLLRGKKSSKFSNVFLVGASGRFFWEKSATPPKNIRRPSKVKEQFK